MLNRQQTIAIIGASSPTGSIFATRLSGNGYRLLLADKESRLLEQMMKRLQTELPSADLEGYDCNHSACWDSDMILLCVPTESIDEVTDLVRNVVTRKVILMATDTGYHSGESRRAVLEQERDIRKRLPHSKVASVRIVLDSTEDPADLSERPRLYYSAQDADAVESVVALAKRAGFEPVEFRTVLEHE